MGEVHKLLKFVWRHFWTAPYQSFWRADWLPLKAMNGQPANVEDEDTGLNLQSAEQNGDNWKNFEI